jgi:DNA-binding NarL/FixJ family response regulator
MSSGVIDILQVLDDLSALDRSILRGAGSGLSSKQIARLVKRSPHTIDDRMKMLKRRLGVTDRAGGEDADRLRGGSAPLND